MTRIWKRIAGLFSLGFLFLLFGGSSSSCDVSLANALLSDDDCNVCDSGRSNSSSSYDDEVETDDKLLVSGSGEHINLEYNELVFPAILNYDSGLYYFSPDPEGEITGDKIICSASIDEDDLEGDCFRQGHVCHFGYWYDEWNSTDDKDAYNLGTTSCREGGEAGPFLVPLESPVCGEDPYPTCLTEDLFPDGPADDSQIETETPSPESQPTDSPELQPVSDEPQEGEVQ